MRLLSKLLLVIFTIAILADLYLIARPTPVARAPAKVHKLGAIVRLVRDGRTFCTGTVVTPNAIVTAAHCTLIRTPFGEMPTDEAIEVRAEDNVDRHTEGLVVFASGQMDQAVLTGDFHIFESKPIITKPELLTRLSQEKNLTFISCGYPLFGDLYCTEMLYVRHIGFMWATKGVLLPGMSGGPAMLPDGTLVAVNVAVEGEDAIVSPVYNVIPPLRQ